MNTQDPDNNVIKMVLLGDVDAFEIIIDRYSNKFRRYVRRVGVVPPHDDDILQEAFLKIYKNLNGFNPAYKFSSWAYRITHNEAVSHGRKKQRTHTFYSDEERERFWDGVLDEQTVVSTIIDTEDLLAHEDMKSHLTYTISMLDRKYADPIILHFFEGKSYKEISDVLRIPTATVGTRIRRAKERIRRQLDTESI